MKVVIVGAGVAGLSIGIRLCQAGADVVVLERAQPAHGATWAAAGMISVTGEGQENPAEAALAHYGAARWSAFAHEIETCSGRTIAYRKDGKLVVARTPEQFLRLEALAVTNAELSIVSAAVAREMEPMLDAAIVGALCDPSEAQVDTRALGQALVAAFLGAGGVLQANEAVVRVETDGESVIGARTPFHLYEGDAYLLAAGAWTARLEGIPEDALPPVIPVKGEMIALQGETLPRRIIWGEGVYLVPRAGRVLVGATASREGFDTGLTEEARDWLLSRAGALMPALASWEVVEHWAGLRPGSPDDLPILGRTAIDRLYVASGQFRNGILFAPAIADALCALLLDRQPPVDLSPFDPRRFSNTSLAKKIPLG